MRIIEGIEITFAFKEVRFAFTDEKSPPPEVQVGWILFTSEAREPIEEESALTFRLILFSTTKRLFEGLFIELDKLFRPCFVWTELDQVEIPKPSKNNTPTSVKAINLSEAELPLPFGAYTI